MALILLQVLVLGVTAAAVDDEALAWSQRGPCAVAAWTKIQQRPPPPPLDDGGIPHTWSAPNDTLEVMIEPDDHQVHQCAVTHYGGIVLGYPLSLQVLYTDAELKPQHQDEKTLAARPQVVPCELDAQYRLPGNNNRYFTVQSETLNLDIKTENEAHYRCKATKPKRHKSSNYEDRLEDSFYEDKYDNNVGKARSKVLLTCPLHGWPRRNFTWEMTPADDDSDDVLVLPNLAHDQEGVFTCTALGGHTNASVIEPVRMLYSPASKEARRASTVRFNCTATGNPKPRISWYKDGRPLVTSAQINVRKSPDGQRQELVIGGLTVENAGVYQCFAHGPGGFASGWAQLNVTGPRASPPEGVRCFPVNAHSVELRWQPAYDDLAYTVSIEPRDRADAMQQPFNTTHTVSKLEKPLTPYKFRVRAYLTYGASDFSPVVVCQGQGVPIKMMKSGEDKVVVSWKSFAVQAPGVVQWVLQYRPQDSALPHNITLPGAVHNYTLTVTPGKPMLVRLLGSRTLDWLPQNLSLVSWTSTARAGHDLDDGPVEATVEDVSVTAVRPRVVSLRWRCVRCPPRHTFRVCARASQGPDECRDSVKPNATIEGLSPDTVYELRVQVRVAGRPPGPFSTPYQVTTQADGPQRINVTYKFVNESAVLVSWREPPAPPAPPAAYTVYHSAQLLLPVELWDDVSVAGNSVLITGIRPTEKTYVMVTDHDPQRSSPILTVPPYWDVVKPNYKFEYSARGVMVYWEGGGSRLVRYSQNITRPLEHWSVVNATGGVVELEILEPSLPTFVQFPGFSDQPLNIPPRPPSNQYLGLEVGCTVGFLCLIAVVGACLWRRRKRMQQPARSRRSHAAAAGSEEEGSEMKTVGARLCNGAGEPLLNGHVHITENPASKTPNGRMKRGRRLENQFDAFDLSRNDADTTHETMLDDSCAFDATRPEPTKLPDDNMNMEPGFRDNSQAQPTLQPNG